MGYASAVSDHGHEPADKISYLQPSELSQVMFSRLYMFDSKLIKDLSLFYRTTFGSNVFVKQTQMVKHFNSSFKTYR